MDQELGPEIWFRVVDVRTKGLLLLEMLDVRINRDDQKLNWCMAEV
jgi:hypothetical protein